MVLRNTSPICCGTQAKRMKRGTALLCAHCKMGPDGCGVFFLAKTLLATSCAVGHIVLWSYPFACHCEVGPGECQVWPWGRFLHSKTTRQRYLPTSSYPLPWCAGPVGLVPCGIERECVISDGRAPLRAAVFTFHFRLVLEKTGNVGTQFPSALF
jgi:hypothetical protein